MKTTNLGESVFLFDQCFEELDVVSIPEKYFNLIQNCHKFNISPTKLPLYCTEVFYDIVLTGPRHSNVL